MAFDPKPFAEASVSAAILAKRTAVAGNYASTANDARQIIGHDLRCGESRTTRHVTQRQVDAGATPRWQPQPLTGGTPRWQLQPLTE